MLSRHHTLSNLQELISFTSANGTVLSIPLQIGTKFHHFGVLLLKDRNGTVDNIIHKRNNDPERINTVILKEWLNGSGKQPMTWEIIVFLHFRPNREIRDSRRLTYYSIDREYIQKYSKEHGDAQNK